MKESKPKEQAIHAALPVLDLYVAAAHNEQGLPSPPVAPGLHLQSIM